MASLFQFISDHPIFFAAILSTKILLIAVGYKLYDACKSRSLEEVPEECEYDIEAPRPKDEGTECSSQGLSESGTDIDDDGVFYDVSLDGEVSTTTRGRRVRFADELEQVQMVHSTEEERDEQSLCWMEIHADVPRQEAERQKELEVAHDSILVAYGMTWRERWHLRQDVDDFEHSFRAQQ